MHHHLAPPAYIADLKKHQRGAPPTLEWTPEKSLVDMDSSGIATAVLSITTPGVWFGDGDDAGAATLARACNDYGAKLIADHGRRFGMFAALPLPDVDGTSQGDRIRARHAQSRRHRHVHELRRQMARRSRLRPAIRRAQSPQGGRLYPSDGADCCANLIARGPESIIEYGTDTTRTIASLLFTGTAARFPDIKFIFSHAGGTMPFLIERFVRHPLSSKAAAANTREGVMPLLQRFHYDTAQVSNPAAMAALTKLVATSQILFGTDFPFRNAADQIDGLQKIFVADDLRKIGKENARAFLPRLQSI